ncbi:MAG: hypothetical protein COB02_06195 [Candidatus Cloacimonadota bacterium]|nr:MAG: hypothetical protein COB02_06195 [Candidatus Cloacimonadota bacterium]
MYKLSLIFLIICSISFCKGDALDRYGQMDTSYSGLLQDKLDELQKKQAENKNSPSSSSDFDTSFLIASLIWGSIGGGYFMYGKKSQKPEALIGGIIMMISSYFCGPLIMSIVGVGIMVGVYKVH